MPAVIVLMNHDLTDRQSRVAHELAGEGGIVSPSPDLQNLWRQVPPEVDGVSAHFDPIRKWLGEVGRPGDYVLIQGDFGAAFLMVRHAFSLGMLPVYATSRRETVEKTLEDGSVRQERIFRHVRFRKYERMYVEKKYDGNIPPGGL